MTLTETERQLITRAREIGPALRASSGDRDRLAGWLLAELADLAERLAGDHRHDTPGQPEADDRGQLIGDALRTAKQPNQGPGPENTIPDCPQCHETRPYIAQTDDEGRHWACTVCGHEWTTP